MFGLNKKRILIIGMPDLVLHCISALKKARKNIVGVITSPENDTTYDYMVKFLADNKILHIKHKKNFKDADFLHNVKVLKPDIALVCSFNYKLPKELYEIPVLGTLNIHPSLLPQYRGANPYFHVINNNEKETGVTLHFMDEDFDTGDIVKQIKFSLLPQETMGSLFNKSNEISAKLCVDVINFIEKGGILPRISQPKINDLKLAKKIFSGTDDVKIDWSKSTDEIERFIRALNPFFGATSIINGIELKFWEVEIIKNPAAKDLPFGTVCDITQDAIYISVNDGFIKTHILAMDETNYFFDTKKIAEIACLKKGDRFNF